ncbi:MAG: hypothetical protein OQL19_18405 [Gammaproteobacteria bacterium]|nr:hypothetical protein [Gammaproteobacteria bacterium]
MDIDEKNAMREDMLKDQRHERMMRSNIEYFCEFTLENLYIITDGTKGIYLFDVIDELKKHCDKYEQDFNEFLDYLKEI